MVLRNTRKKPTVFEIDAKNGPMYTSYNPISARIPS